ncbi:MAG TPA: DoxX-like family protein [Ferruginibacter sp.]|nr:DoxX-like family protein [Ferruginibacter sp.]
MNNKKPIHLVLTYFIATVWIGNGLFCKLLNFVPRHQLIVARILGNEHAALFTKAIGFSEMLMAVWILSSIKPRFCALTQMIIIATMNTIEFFLARDLLLFGKLNALFAFLFIALILYNEFVLG